MQAVWARLCPRLTDYEVHRTDVSYEDSLAVKLFTFAFVNHFAVLFYIAFVLRGTVRLPGLGRPAVDSCADDDCLGALSAQLTVMVVYRQVLRHTFTALRNCCHVRWRCARCPPWSWARTDTRGQLLDRVGAQAALPTYPGEDFLEMAIQFCYVTIFGSAFPLGACIFFVNNVVEAKADARRLLLRSKRPRYRGAASIGVWESVFAFIAAMAVATNAFLLYFNSRVLSALLQRTLGRREYALLFIVAVEHMLFFIRWAIELAIPDEPRWVDHARARAMVTLSMAINKLEEHKAANAGDDEAGAAHLAERHAMHLFNEDVEEEWGAPDAVLPPRSPLKSDVAKFHPTVHVHAPRKAQDAARDAPADFAHKVLVHRV